MMTNKELAELIFPNVKETIEDLEKRYPERNLPNGAEVTRFAPSPTGFLHTGSLFTSLVCKTVARQTNGIFFVRLEDTDTKREIQGSGNLLLEQLKVFNVYPDEGYMGDHEEGNYGPYIQSQRADIYRVVIKELLAQGKAYPCFCSPEELQEIRKVQEAKKENPGYYGEYAKCRNLDNDTRAKLIKEGKPFVIRFRSEGDHTNKIAVHDEVRGDFEIAQNDLDIVIYKSDELPTYHFAHAVDDHFMRTTTVIRGEEWVASLPIHVELFEALGWKAPKYAHLPVIMKVDEETGNKRKLSKRKDAEAACSFFIEDGYPSEALIMYLMTIANSNFEAWIFEHNFKNMEEFQFSFDKMSADGALFDMGKLTFFVKEILGGKNKDQMTELALAYTEKYQPEFNKLISNNIDYFKEIINIEREKENPRKDYAKMSDILPIVNFFYNEYYEDLVKDGFAYNFEKFSKEDIASSLEALKELDASDCDEQTWFGRMKEIGYKLGFAGNNKEYKANPEAFKGTTGDVAELLRVTLTSRKNSPNLYYVMKILGKGECNRRLEKAISFLK